MRLEGIHHVTCITGDAPGNVDFYTRVLGLRLVKKTVNQDDPTVYHLFYADEAGSAGSRHHLLRVPGRAPRAAPARGMVHRDHRGASPRRRRSTSGPSGSAGEGVATQRAGGRLRFDDPEGLGLELAVAATDDAPLVAEHPEIPAELALQGFDGVRAFSRRSRAEPTAARGDARLRAGRRRRRGRRAARRAAGSTRTTRRRPGPERPGAGTVHHVAWSSTMDEHEAWRDARRGRRDAPIAGDRPLLVPLDLLPRAERRPLRDRDARAGLRRRRAARITSARRSSLPPAFEHLRGAARAGADAAAEPARRQAHRVSSARRCIARATPGTARRGL